MTHGDVEVSRNFIDEYETAKFAAFLRFEGINCVLINFVNYFLGASIANLFLMVFVDLSIAVLVNVP